MKKILPAAFLALWTAALCLPEAARALAGRTGLLSFEPFPAREEKRHPAPRPDLFEKAPRLVPRSLYGRAAENWYNDHFAWRTELVRLGRRIRFGLLREPVGRDVPGLDGWFFMRSTWRELEDYVGALDLDDGALAEWVELFEARHAWAEACGTHFIELLTAPKARVRAEKLRPDIRRLRARGVADRLRDALASSPARDDVLFVDDDLAAGLAAGREVFFAVDHHPTPYGLWLLYDRLNRRLLDLFPDRVRGTFPWYDDPPPAVLDGSEAGCWPRDGRLAVSSPGEEQDDRTIGHNAARYPYCNVETDRPEGGLTLVLAHDSFLRFTLESWCGRDGDVRFPFAPGVGRVRAFLFRRLRPDLLESETAHLVPDAFVHHAERSLGILPERVDLVTHPAAVEVDLSVFFAVKMVERHPVGVAVVADNGEHAAGRGPQDFKAFLIRHLLLETKHFSEHVCSSITLYRHYYNEEERAFQDSGDMV